MNLLLLLQRLERVPEQMSKGHLSCALTNPGEPLAPGPEEGKGCSSSVKAVQGQPRTLGSGRADSFSVGPHVRPRREGTESNCPQLIGGKALSNPLSCRESKTRHANSSSWLLSRAGLSQEWKAFLTCCSSRRRGEGSKGVSPIALRRQVGRRRPARLRVPPGLGWNSCCCYEHAPTKETPYA